MEAGGLIKWTVGVHSSADPSPSAIALECSLTPTDWDDITRGLIKRRVREGADDIEEKRTK